MWTIVTSILRTQVSPTAADLILDSIRHSTKSQYGVYLVKYLEYEKTTTIRDIDTPKLLRYLTYLYEQGLGYSAINTARSALSTVSDILAGKKIGEDSIIRRFMKGVFHSRPSLPRYVETWDPEACLSKLDTDSETMPLIEFSRKVVFLVTLLSGQRLSVISNLRLCDVSMTNTSITIPVTEQTKQTRPGYHQKPLCFHRFPNRPNICAYTQLALYIERSKPLRTVDCTKLFITTTRPYKNASKATIGNWIKHILQICGLKDFAPHSLRGASTSAAAARNMPVDQILEAAGWSSESTFRKFYNRPAQKVGLDVYVLDNVVDC